MRWIVVVVVLGGCLQSKATECASGTVCPDGTACDVAHGACVTPDRLTACDTLHDGDACLGSGRCDSGVCLEPRCGDGVVQTLEDCDKANLAGATCDSLGFYGGSPNLACSTDCTFDTSACGSYCGDHVIDSPEEDCDKETLPAVSCDTIGFYNPGPVSCNAVCHFNTSMCHGRCGDHTIDLQEACDGAPPVAQTCVSDGYDYGRLGCSLACGADLTACSKFGFVPEPRTTPQALNAIVSLGGGQYLALASGATAFNRGGAWITVAMPMGGVLVDVWADGPSSIIAVGHTNEILHGTFDPLTGVTWTPHAVTLTKSASVWGSSPTDVYVASTGLLHFDGTSWLPFGDHATSTFIDLSGAGTTLYALTNDGHFLRYTGPTGTDLGTIANARHIYAAAVDDVYVSGSLGLFHYTAAGISRVELPFAVDSIDGITGSGPDHVLVTTASHAGTRSDVMEWDGSRWWNVDTRAAPYLGLASASPTDDVVLQTNDDPLHRRGQVVGIDTTERRPMAAVWSSDISSVAVGPAGSILLVRRGTNSSAFWMASNTTEDLRAVWGADLDHVFAVGDHGTIMQFHNATWSKMTSPTTVNLTGVFGKSATDVFAVGDGGTIVHFNGTAWSTTDSSTTEDLTAIVGFPGTDPYATTKQGRIIGYTGTGWVQSLASVQAALNGICVDGARLVAVGAGGKVYTGTGAPWTKMTTVTTATLHDCGSGVAVGDNGMFYDLALNKVITTQATTDDVIAVDEVGGLALTAAGDFQVADRGRGWGAVTFPNVVAQSIWGDGGTALVAGLNGLMSLHLVGAQWFALPTPVVITPRWGTSATDVWGTAIGVAAHFDGTAWTTTAADVGEPSDLVGIGTTIFVSGNTGVVTRAGSSGSFTSISSEPVVSLWGSSPTDLYAGAANGIRHYDGTAWTAVGAPIAFPHVWGSAANDVFAVGSGGMIQHFDGTAWSTQTSGTQALLDGVHGTSSSDVWAYSRGVAAELVHFDGVAWSPVRWATAVNQIFVEPHRIAIAGSDLLRVILR